MNRIESFALQSALKIERPFINESFFPISHDKYITFNNGSQADAKKYPLIQDAINLINPYLEKNNIGLYQLGVPGEETYQECNVLVGGTNLNQASYILSRSSLHFGVDGVLNHIASSYHKPVVALYSGLPASVCSPYFNKEDNLVNLSGLARDALPSYNENEPSKTINKIMPEEVAYHILKLLNIDNTLHLYKTIFIGDMYNSPIIECVPDFSPDATFFPQSMVHVRMDYHFDEKQIPNFANGRKVAIITKDPIQDKYLLAAKDNISMITYRIDERSDPDFVQRCIDLGLQINLISSNASSISETRLQFFDWPVRLVEAKSKKDLDNCREICENTYFKCKKTIHSQAGQFPSKHHWENNITSEEENLAIDSPVFWEELDHLYLYNHDQDSKNKSGGKN